MEKEILEDARKKAERILKNADKQIAGLEKEWKEKTGAELALLSAEAEAKKSLRKKGVETTFPLEAQRRKLRFMDGIFEKFLEDFFAKLTPEDLERVLLEKAKAFAAFFAGKSADGVKASYAGISREAAARIAAAFLGGAVRLEEGAGFTGLVVSAEGGACRCRLEAAELAAELREYHRKRIMDALWKEHA
ncbi:MAG: hypothetical protein FWG35_00560 [Spirochaetaceae bacterium]|nr:hypothetical protein [Spirochaetaceae bacterium]